MAGATWLVGVGIVMLGLNAARYLNGIRVRGFTMILGVLALAAGLGNFAGVDLELPLFSALLILLGAGIILKPLIERDRSTPAVLSTTREGPAPWGSRALRDLPSSRR